MSSAFRRKEYHWWQIHAKRRRKTRANVVIHHGPKLPGPLCGLEIQGCTRLDIAQSDYWGRIRIRCLGNGIRIRAYVYEVHTVHG
jgi:hypothetical protein